MHRFVTAEPRRTRLGQSLGPAARAPARRRSARTRADWIRWQGPHSPESAWTRSHRRPPTSSSSIPTSTSRPCSGSKRYGRGAVMHPAAHDEPPIRLPVFRDVFAAARGLVFQTHAEADFVNRLFRVGATPQIILGLGSDPKPRRTGAGSRSRSASATARTSSRSGGSTTARARACSRGTSPSTSARIRDRLRSCSSGPVVHQPPAHPDVIVTGVVDEATKWGLLRDAVALVQPSGFEAFSLVLVEAWHAGRPVLVNARCFATREHCERSGGGLWFDGYSSFEVSVDRLVGGARPTRRDGRGRTRVRGARVHLAGDSRPVSRVPRTDRGVARGSGLRSEGRSAPPPAGFRRRSAHGTGTDSTAATSAGPVRSRSKSRRRRVPAATSCARSAPSRATRATAAATVHASLLSSTRPASSSVSGTAAAPYAIDRYTVLHGLEDGDAEAFVLAEDHESVRGGVVRGELGRADATGEGHCVGESEVGHEPLQTHVTYSSEDAPPTRSSRAAGSWKRRYAANAFTTSCWALLGARRPTNSQRVPVAVAASRVGQRGIGIGGARPARAGSGRRSCAGTRLHEFVGVEGGVADAERGARRRGCRAGAGPTTRRRPQPAPIRPRIAAASGCGDRR